MDHLIDIGLYVQRTIAQESQYNKDVSLFAKGLIGRVIEHQLKCSYRVEIVGGGPEALIGTTSIWHMKNVEYYEKKPFTIEKLKPIIRRKTTLQDLL